MVALGRYLAVAGLAGLLLWPLPAAAQGDTDLPYVRYAGVTFDVVVLRPLGLAAAAVGCAFFPAVVLLAAPGGLDPMRDAWQHFVLNPGKHVFVRPLGDF